MVDGRILLLSAQGDRISSDLPLMLRSLDGGFVLNGAVYPGLCFFAGRGPAFLLFNEVGLELCSGVFWAVKPTLLGRWRPLRRMLVAQCDAVLCSIVWGNMEYTIFVPVSIARCIGACPRPRFFRTAVVTARRSSMTWQGAPIDAVVSTSRGRSDAE